MLGESGLLFSMPSISGCFLFSFLKLWLRVSVCVCIFFPSFFYEILLWLTNRDFHRFTFCGRLKCINLSLFCTCF